MKSSKSDVPAKAAYVKELKNRGFNTKVVNAPADIEAIKDGQVWYFEIKTTKKSDRYFGAATMTEWKQAFEDPEHYRFVIAIDKGNENWEFIEFTPDELMELSTIPPFKVDFNIDVSNKDYKPKRRSTTIRLSRDNFTIFSRAFYNLKRG